MKSKNMVNEIVQASRFSSLVEELIAKRGAVKLWTWRWWGHALVPIEQVPRRGAGRAARDWHLERTYTM